MSKTQDFFAQTEVPDLNVIAQPDSTGDVNIDGALSTDVIDTNTNALETIKFEKSLQVKDAVITTNSDAGYTSFYSENNTLKSRNESGEIKVYVDTLDTKGDIATFDGSLNKPSRLPLGTNGFYLQADSSSDLGIKWSQVLTSATLEDSFSFHYNTNGNEISTTPSTILFDNNLVSNSRNVMVDDTGVINIVEDGEYYVELSPTYLKLVSSDINIVKTWIEKADVLNGLWQPMPALEAHSPVWLSAGVQTCTAGLAFADNSVKGDKYRVRSERDEEAAPVVNGNLFFTVRESIGNGSITGTYSTVPFDTVDYTSGGVFSLQSGGIQLSSPGVYYVSQNINVSMSSDSTSIFSTRLLVNGVEVPDSIAHMTVPIMNTPQTNIARETCSIPLTMYVEVVQDDIITVEVREETSNNVGILFVDSKLDVMKLDTPQRYQYNLQQFNVTSTGFQVIPITGTPNASITAGSPFTVASGTMTCQVSGVYVFIFNIHHNYFGDTTEDCYSRIQPRINGGNQGKRAHIDNFGIAGGKNTSTIHYTFNLNSGNTIDFRIRREETNSSNSTDFMQLQSSSTLLVQQFGGNSQIFNRDTNNQVNFSNSQYTNVQQNSGRINQGNVGYGSGLYTVNATRNVLVFTNYNFRSNVNTTYMSLQTRELADNTEIPGCSVHRTTSQFKSNNLGISSMYSSFHFTSDGNTNTRGQVRANNFLSMRYDDTQIKTLVLLDEGTATLGAPIQLEPLNSGLSLHKTTGEKFSNFFTTTSMPVTSSEQQTDILNTRINNIPLTLQNDTITFSETSDYLVYVSVELSKTGLFSGVVEHRLKVNATTVHSWKTISFLDLDADVNNGSGWTKYPLKITSGDALTFTHLVDTNITGLSITAFNVVIQKLSTGTVSIRNNSIAEVKNNLVTTSTFDTSLETSTVLSTNNTELIVQKTGWYAFGTEVSFSNSNSDSKSYSNYFEVSYDRGINWTIPPGNLFNNVITTNSHVSGNLLLFLPEFARVRSSSFLNSTGTVNLLANRQKLWGALIKESEDTDTLVYNDSRSVEGIQDIMYTTFYSDGGRIKLEVYFNSADDSVDQRVELQVTLIRSVDVSLSNSSVLLTSNLYKQEVYQTLDTSITKYLTLPVGGYTLVFSNNQSNTSIIKDLTVSISK